MDFVAPNGVTMTEFDRTTGGLVTPYCPRNVISRGAFKSGTEPTQPCQPHSAAAAMPSTVVPMYDEFGNLIITDTASTMTDTGGIAPPLPPDATLTGGVFQPEAQVPPAQQPPPVRLPPVRQPPPPTTTAEDPPEEPPPATDTSTTTQGGSPPYS